MANVHLNPRVVKQVTELVSEETVSLQLSIYEASVLYNIFCHIGGCPRESDRKITQDLYHQFQDIGFTRKGTGHISGSIECHNYEETE
jgi:hypothetical protein